VADADPFSWARSLCLRTAGVLASRYPASTSSIFVGKPHFPSFLTPRALFPDQSHDSIRVSLFSFVCISRACARPPRAVITFIMRWASVTAAIVAVFAGQATAQDDPDIKSISVRIWSKGGTGEYDADSSTVANAYAATGSSPPKADSHVRIQLTNLGLTFSTQPYLDSDMSSRWFDFGGDTIIRTDSYVINQTSRRVGQGQLN
jgi:hypothetical protein